MPCRAPYRAKGDHARRRRDAEAGVQARGDGLDKRRLAAPVQAFAARNVVRGQCCVYGAASDGPGRVGHALDDDQRGVERCCAGALLGGDAVQERGELACRV